MWMKPRGDMDASFSKYTAIWKKPILEKTAENKEDDLSDDNEIDSDDDLSRGEDLDDDDFMAQSLPKSNFLQSRYNDDDKPFLPN